MLGSRQQGGAQAGAGARCEDKVLELVLVCLAIHPLKPRRPPHRHRRHLKQTRHRHRHHRLLIQEVLLKLKD